MADVYSPSSDAEAPRARYTELVFLPKSLLAYTMFALFVGAAVASFVGQGPAPRLSSRRSLVVASAKIIPIANLGLGAALVSKAAGAAGPSRVVLASTGLLACLNLAVVDNARYTGAKRAYKKIEGLPKDQLNYFGLLSKKWYNLVRFLTFGQWFGLCLMVRAPNARGVLVGAAAFMAVNTMFFTLGAPQAKHDGDGLYAPISPKVAKFVRSTDAVLTAAAALGAAAAAGTVGHAIGAYIFSAGCMIGVLEGVPKTSAGLKQLLRSRTQ